MELVEIKALIDNQGKAWDEFKKNNELLISAKADGKAVSDLEAKAAKIEKDLDQIAEIKAQFEEVMKKMQRPSGFQGKSDVDPEIEVKHFNVLRRARGITEELDVKTYDEYKKTFWLYARKGDPIGEVQRKAMSSGSDPDGGFMVPEEDVGRMVKKIYELSPIRQVASVQAISTNTLEGMVDNDEAGAGWVGETQVRADTSTPQVGKYNIEAFEMYAQPKATQKLLDDSAVSIENWLMEKVSDKFARLEGAAFISGDGVSQPRGFATYPTAATGDGSRAWGTFEHLATGVSGGFAASSPADIIISLVSAFKTAYLQNARFITRREVISLIRKFKDTTNQYLWQPSLQLGIPDSLFGYPTLIAQDMPAVAANSLSLAFGDFKEAYQIVDRMGLRTLRDPYTDKPYVKFYSTRRVGGGAVNFEALKFVKFI